MSEPSAAGFGPQVVAKQWPLRDAIAILVVHASRMRREVER